MTDTSADRLTGHQTPPKEPTREDAIDAAYRQSWDTIRDALTKVAQSFADAGATRREALDSIQDISGDCRADALGSVKFAGE